jgi:transposase
MMPGSVRDMSTVCATVREMGRRDAVIVIDRGFWSEENMSIISGSGMDFIMPVKRTSRLYGTVPPVNEFDTFGYRGRLIRYSKAGHGGHHAYRFRDETMRLGEEEAAFAKHREGKLSAQEIGEKKERMGEIMIVSSLDTEPEDIYLMFKRRDSVEKRFRTFKTVLDADASYLRDNVSAFGHVFVTFLSMYIVANLEDRIRKAGILSKVSAEDVLLEYSKAYAVELESGTVDYEVPKKLRDLDERLGFNIFPILRS